MYILTLFCALESLTSIDILNPNFFNVGGERNVKIEIHKNHWHGFHGGSPNYRKVH